MRLVSPRSINLYIAPPHQLHWNKFDRIRLNMTNRIQKKLKEFGCNVELRTIMNNPYITDNSNYIIDCEFDKIDNPEQLEVEINIIPGVVENGLFINLADNIIVGSKQGIKTLSK